jgi:hypothetical protein
MPVLPDPLYGDHFDMLYDFLLDELVADLNAGEDEYDGVM